MLFAARCSRRVRVDDFQVVYTYALDFPFSDAKVRALLYFSFAGMTLPDDMYIAIVALIMQQ